MSAPASTTPADRTTSLVEVPHDGWDALVARLGGDDAYLRLGWHLSAALLEDAPAQPVLLHGTGDGWEWALPLLVRELPGDAAGHDATTCYGYGGPIALGTPDLGQVRLALDAWASDRDVVATFLRCHPVLATQSAAPGGTELVELGSTVLWDLTGDRDLLASMHSHHRRAVRKAERAGATIRITDGPADLAAFRALYDDTMRRQDADAFYFFADDYWDELLSSGGGGRIVLVEAVLPERDDDGEPVEGGDQSVVASLLCVAHGRWLHYHLGASADAARSIGASNACFLAAAEWGRAHGLDGFHLGGGVGGGSDSPLFTFKHRYDPSSEPRPFVIGKLVHQADRYRELAGTDSTAGYFPPWRAPGR